MKQNNQTLISITDQYEIAKPYASAYVYMPEITGNEPFTIEVDLYNDGKVDATVQFGIQSLEFGDSQTVTIPPGEMKILYYSQQISKNVTYTFTFGGDYEGDSYANCILWSWGIGTVRNGNSESAS